MSTESKEEVERLKKVTEEIASNLKYLWERSIEAKGACYISSMERGDIERVLEKYNALKSVLTPTSKEK